MDGRGHIATRFLVLRLSPYSDTSLVAAGLSPDQGQLHFLVRGARRLGPRQFPVLDLFRVLQVTYRDTRSELHRLSSVDLTADYGAVAQRYDAYQAAEWHSRFVLGNVVTGVGQEALFEALCVGLARLADPGEAAADGAADGVVTGVVLTYLLEGGWLPDPGGETQPARQCRALLEMAAGRAPPPRLTAANWRDLRHWALGLARAAETEVPAGP